MLSKQEFSESCKSLLKKIIFDKSHLNSLKQDIKDFNDKTITPKELKRRILIAKAEVLESLLETLPFYFQTMKPLERDGKNPKSPKSNSDINVTSKITALEGKLQEREELLEIIAQRLERIRHNKPKLEKKSSKLAGKTFILDGSNIARHNQNSKKASIGDVIGSKNILLDAGIPEENIYIIFGSGLHHHISDEERKIYDNLLQKRNNVQAPAGADDDWFIIQHGLKHNSYIITNDLYSEYKEKGEKYKDYIEKHSIRYSIIGNDIYFEKELGML
jgi:hypothetical protein